MVDESDWINGAFFVLEPACSTTSRATTRRGSATARQLAAEGELMAYRHEDFWQCMDTLRGRVLSGLWEEGAAPWKIWE